jgi:CDP-diacylglycerol--serine O-phosphatidyltransferase
VVLFSLFVAYGLSGYVMWVIRRAGRSPTPPPTLPPPEAGA